MSVVEEKCYTYRFNEDSMNPIQNSRLFAQRIKYLTRLHISAIFFCRVVEVMLALLDCALSVSFWT